MEFGYYIFAHFEVNDNIIIRKHMSDCQRLNVVNNWYIKPVNIGTRATNIEGIGHHLMKLERANARVGQLAIKIKDGLACISYKLHLDYGN